MGKMICDSSFSLHLFVHVNKSLVHFSLAVPLVLQHGAELSGIIVTSH